MWGILNNYLQESRRIRTLCKTKQLERLRDLPAPTFLTGAEFILSMKKDLRIFIEAGSLHVHGVSESSLCSEFDLPSNTAVLAEDSFVDSGRDFLARMRSLSTLYCGTTGSSLYWYGDARVLADFLLKSELLLRLRVIRIFVVNRVRRRLYVCRVLPSLTSATALTWASGAFLTVGTFCCGLLASQRRFLVVLVMLVR